MFIYNLNYKITNEKEYIMVDFGDEAKKLKKEGMDKGKDMAEKRMKKDKKDDQTIKQE